MKREEFISILDRKRYSYEIEGDKIIVTYNDDARHRDVLLSKLTEIPPNVIFNNGGYVNLKSLGSVPRSVQFNNGGYVELKSTSLNRYYIFNFPIDNIDNRRIFNILIKRGIFE